MARSTTMLVADTDVDHSEMLESGRRVSQMIAMPSHMQLRTLGRLSWRRAVCVTLEVAVWAFQVHAQGAPAVRRVNGPVGGMCACLW